MKCRSYYAIHYFVVGFQTFVIVTKIYRSHVYLGADLTRLLFPKADLSSLLYHTGSN